MAVTEALNLSRDDLVTLARNSIEASFLGEAEMAPHLARLDAMATSLRGA
jgi:adenosine deaminase